MALSLSPLVVEVWPITNCHLEKASSGYGRKVIWVNQSGKDQIRDWLFGLPLIKSHLNGGEPNHSRQVQYITDFRFSFAR
ncbi:hypothetical protein CEXT_68411 [Caerostris extrusa]|uniref:Uncharacterized protein n=1 Tax=Caerostris extrusa TaxID=172846 RepID=A0AAV4MPR3_CAEEX|nr:hypothetical protein CEXT_68411 [Caerostris extrusa]